MARQVVRTESAWQELEAAAQYIARDSPRYAAALMDEAKFASRSLQMFPERGRRVPELGDISIREIFIKNYRMLYEISLNEVVILTFLHGARQFPGILR